MNHRFAKIIVSILMGLLLASPVLAASRPLDRANLPRIMESPGHVPRVADSAGKAVTDTFRIIGPWSSEATVNGQFQTPEGQPAWNGWTSHDLTSPPENHWHVSDYQETGGNLSLYCGDETIPACQADDPIGGYGNDWSDAVELRYQVADAGAGCDIVVSGLLSHDTEVGYDFLSMEFLTADGPVPVEVFDGEVEQYAFSHEFSYGPLDYVGENLDEVVFRCLFTSDPGYADTDCLFYGSGAARLDDIQVTCSNGDFAYFEDFQSGNLGLYTVPPTMGVGDFAGLWQGLEDLDPCLTNYSPQVAFIDDGTQVPGAGPSHCITWCYGPGGYVVNHTGGASTQEDAHLYNVVRSPAVTWDGTQLDGGVLSFDAYRHEELGFNSTGIFYFWEIRSAVNPEDLETAVWDTDGLIYSGGPSYIRESFNVTPYLVPGATTAQVQMGAYQLGWIWGIDGDDGTPAPYFDNVSLKVFDMVGPTFRATDYSLAQDAFPEAGVLNLEDLAANNVRFDMAWAPNGSFGSVPIPGDSLVVRIRPTRPGGVVEQPKVHYTINRNPLFDAVRDPAYGPSGVMDGYPNPNNQDFFSFDLPDSGFLFPGDVIHYYFSAVETVDGLSPETGTVPSDLAGYGLFDQPRKYDENFVMRALPTLHDADGNQPALLLWDDSNGGDDPEKWFWSLRNLGYEEGLDYDRYYTKAARQGLANGLGARCNIELLSRYAAIIYTSGAMASNTLGVDDPYGMPSPDIPLLEEWLALGSKGLLLMGDRLAGDLNSEATDFLQNTMRIEYYGDDIRPIINDQTTPRVLAVPGNPVFQVTEAWILDGGCPDLARFDAIGAQIGSERLAQFTNPAGQPTYPHAAGVLSQLDSESKVITLPFGLNRVADDPDYPVSAPHHRTALLQDALLYLFIGGHPPVSVPAAGVFQLGNHPNPFNPATRIEFNLPQDGRIEVKVFNLRGELVRTLLDEERSAGAGHVMWDGKDGAGAQVGSGLYFCEARAAGEVKVQKMTLLK